MDTDTTPKMTRRAIDRQNADAADAYAAASVAAAAATPPTKANDAIRVAQKQQARHGPMIALDLFAGTGWGVALQRLGVDEFGVEVMPEAIATRAANGMMTAYHDVWAGLELTTPNFLYDYDLLIASPPCQTFSLAGKGAGRAALEHVLEAIRVGSYKDVAQLRAFGERFDPRTALVLAPLAHVWRDTPRLVVFEQVPPVLPVWEACAEVMREWGYSVTTAILNCEQYGVPQTRRRAILVARWDREATMPTPTHSRYYSRDPKALDAGVLPWVSMADALGWDGPTVTSQAQSWRVRSNYGTGGDPGNRGYRNADEPAATITSKAGRGIIEREINLDPARPATTVAGDPRLSSREHHYHGEQNSTSTKITVAEASALQTYPTSFDWTTGVNGKPLPKTKAFLQIGNAVPPLFAEAIISNLLDPR
jgi:DNA (cytosine-5)-methyltransferase 1